MMEALIFFIVWAGFIFLMMRFGCGAHIMGVGHGKAGQTGGFQGGCRTSANPRWIAPAKDADPVCGKIVATVSAKPSVHDGRVYYFCSRECREVFEAAPDVYIGDGTAKPEKMEHSHA